MRTQSYPVSGSWWHISKDEKAEAAKAKREARKFTRRPCHATLLPAHAKASASAVSAVATDVNPSRDVEAAVDAVAVGEFGHHTMVALVPEGISPGKIFEVHDATAQTFATTCPPDAAPGDKILVQLPDFSLAFCTFVPNAHESDFRALVARVGEEILVADFEALSVDTVSIRGGAHYLNRTKF